MQERARLYSEGGGGPFQLFFFFFFARKCRVLAVFLVVCTKMLART